MRLRAGSSVARDRLLVFLGFFLFVACGAPSSEDRAPATAVESASATAERERLDAVVAEEALKQFGAGGTHEVLARALSGIATNPTSAGKTAKAILGMLRPRPRSIRSRPSPSARSSMPS